MTNKLVDKKNNKKGNKSLNFGHRERLREYIINSSSDNVNKEKLFEYFMCLLRPVRDNRVFAKSILDKLDGNFTSLFNKDINYLKNSLKLTNSVIAGILMFKRMMSIYNSEELNQNNKFDSRTKMIKYFQKEIGYKDTEHIVILFLNSAQKVIERKILGDKNTSLTSFNISDIVSVALNDNAKYIVLSHNHPSGDVKPSLSDKNTTLIFEETIKNINKIELIDHIIVCGNKYFSFYEHGLLKKNCKIINTLADNVKGIK